ncbi:MAG: glycosyltransferase family 39 protein [Desulfurococcus sp.]|uniref:glycosyltransferase family 39 protein n=1 Tax=Desulfurococcus sp. TaxID=51678 RepID=UPI003D13F3EA
MVRERILVIVIAVIAIMVFALNAYHFEELESVKMGKGYVSDEVWYVGSARTILVKVFGLEPRMPEDNYGYTIIYNGQIDYSLIMRIAGKLGVSIRSDYSDLKAFYASGYKGNLTLFIDEIKKYISVSDVIPGWMMPDHNGINNYINQEHPPLGKYITAAVMYLVGDQPLYWRLPVVLLGALSVILVYSSMRKLTGNIVVAFATSLLFMVDPLTRTLFSIVLLDGFTTFFSILSFHYAVDRKYYESLIAGIIAGLFKFTGLFTLIPLLILYLRRELRKNPSFANLAYTTIVFILAATSLFLLAFTCVSIPLIRYMGLGNWVKYSLLGSIEWHTSIKCNGPCPGSSSPWDWFLGVNGFTVYVDPTVVAMGFYPFWSTVLVSLVLLAPLIIKDKRYGILWIYLVGVFTGYLIVWAMGGRSQYSFYSIQLAPFTYMYLVYMVVYVLNKDNITYVGSSYSKLFSYIVKLLLS